MESLKKLKEQYPLPLHLLRKASLQKEKTGNSFTQCLDEAIKVYAEGLKNHCTPYKVIGVALKGNLFLSVEFFVETYSLATNPEMLAIANECALCSLERKPFVKLNYVQALFGQAVKTGKVEVTQFKGESTVACYQLNGQNFATVALLYREKGDKKYELAEAMAKNALFHYSGYDERSKYASIKEHYLAYLMKRRLVFDENGVYDEVCRQLPFQQSTIGQYLDKVCVFRTYFTYSPIVDDYRIAHVVI